MVCEDCFEQGLKEWDVRKEDWKMVKESALIKDYLQGWFIMIDQYDLYRCPKCKEKELVHSQGRSTWYCQVCGEYVEPEEDRDNYDWYFDLLGMGDYEGT